jgi:xanthine permease XanP
MKRIKAGVLGDGVNSLIASICGTFPVVTPAQNNGIIQLTGVGSRYVGYYIAAILMAFGLFPVLVGGLLAIPTAVVGGAVMLMFITVAVAGVNILREIAMDNRSFGILAISLTVGLGVTLFPQVLDQLPVAVKGVLESGIGTGSICAMVLNLVMPKADDALFSVIVEENPMDAAGRVEE